MPRARPHSALRYGTALATPVLLAGALGASGCRGERVDAVERPRPAEPPVPVETAKVTERAVPETLELTGALRGNEQSSVAAGAAGVVREVRVERGDVVARGATLLRIDAETAQARAAEARADLATARAELAQAERNCERYERLHRTGALSRLDYEQQQMQCETAQSRVQAAEERLRSAEKEARDAVVRAPFDGLVAERFVSVGEFVGPESRTVELVSLSPMRLELAVPQEDVARIREGQPVTFRVDTFPDRVFEGKIRYVGPSLDPASRALVVEAIAQNPGRELRPGMFASAHIALGTRRVPVVPRSAIRDAGEASRIFVVEGGEAHERIVELGPPIGDHVVVRSGARPGETVVAPLGPTLRDGARVE